MTDLLAADLRTRRAYDHGPQRCDALDPCADCREVRRLRQTERALSRVPGQRRVA